MEDKNYDLLLERNKFLEAENSEIKSKLDKMMKDMAILTQRLSEFLDKNEKNKTKKRKTNSINDSDEIDMGNNGVLIRSELMHTDNSRPENDDANRQYANNNDSDSAQASTSTHNEANNSEKNFDDCIWRNVLSKNQYQRNKKLTGKNSAEANTTPIQLNKMSSDECATLTKSLFSKFHGKGYIFQQIKNGNNPRILSDNEQIKEDIMKFLDNHSYEYNSYNNNSQKKKSFIIRGFCCNNDSENIDAIKMALDSAGIPDCAVTRFLTGYQRCNPNKAHNLLYRIVVDNTVADEALTNIRTIGFFGIRIEKLRASKAVQCHNCQRFNHTAGQCHYIYRCVQCVDSHGPQQCPRKLNQNFPLGCINCYEAKLDYPGHTANDLKNCSFYQNKISPAVNKAANINTKTNTSQTSTFKPSLSNTTNSNINFGRNFASVVRGTSNTANVDPTQLLAMFSQIAEPLSKLCQFLKNAQK